MIYLDFAWWQWLLAGLALMLLDLVLPSVTILLGGIAAVIVGLATALFPLPTYSPLVLWCVLTAVAVYLRLKFRSSVSQVDDEPEAGVGVRGVLLEDISGPGTAQVLLQTPVRGTRQWPAVADEPIAAGERVYIVSIGDARLTVARALLIDIVN